MAEKDHYRFTATFPTKTTADFDVRISRGQRFTPNQADLKAGKSPKAYNVKFVREIVGSTERVTLTYYLIEGSIPTTVRRPSRQGGLREPGGLFPMRPSAQGARSNWALASTDQNRREESGVLVTSSFTATAKKFAEEGIAALEEGLRAGFLGETLKESSLTAAGSQAFDVVEAFKMSATYEDNRARLCNAEALANTPTNPLTAKAYAQDPNLKQQILDDIADARSELTWDTAAQFINKMATVALGLAELPLAGVAAEPVADWNSRTLEAVIDERITNIEKSVSTGWIDRPPPATGTTSHPPGAPERSRPKPSPTDHCDDSRSETSFIAMATGDFTFEYQGHIAWYWPRKRVNQNLPQGDSTFTIELTTLGGLPWLAAGGKEKQERISFSYGTDSMHLAPGTYRFYDGDPGGDISPADIPGYYDGFGGSMTVSQRPYSRAGLEDGGGFRAVSGTLTIQRIEHGLIMGTFEVLMKGAWPEGQEPPMKDGELPRPASELLRGVFIAGPGPGASRVR